MLMKREHRLALVRDDVEFPDDLGEPDENSQRDGADDERHHCRAKHVAAEQAHPVKLREAQSRPPFNGGPAGVLERIYRFRARQKRRRRDNLKEKGRGLRRALNCLPEWT